MKTEDFILCFVIPLLFTTRFGMTTFRQATMEINDVTVFENEDDFHTRRIDNDGETLTVGSVADKSHGITRGVFRCEEMEVDESYTNKVYDTVIKKSSDGKSRLGSNSLKAEEYFVPISREILTCTYRNGEGPGEITTFIKVVNELISVHQISELRFYDGVEVSTVTRYLGEKRNVRIREIKYLFTDETSQTVSQIKFEGSVHFEKEKAKKEGVKKKFVPNFIKQEYFFNRMTLITQINGQSYELFLEPSSSEIRYLKISTEFGVALEIGSPTSSLFYKQKPKVDTPKFYCTQYNYPSPYHQVFRTEVFGVVTGSIHAPVNDDYFSELFVIAKREVFICHSFERSSGSVPKPFFRVLNTVIGRTPLKSVAYQRESITELKTINVAGGTSVRFEEIKHLDYSGQRNIDLENGIWCYFPEESEDSFVGYRIYVENLLHHPMYVSRTLIDTEGYDLRVGSATTRKVNVSPSTQCKCNPVSPSENYQELFETKIQLKVDGDDKFYTTETIDVNKQIFIFGKKFFILMGRDVWSCSYTQVQEGNRRTEYFTLIENRLKFFVPVREIETYDGVEITATRLSYNRKSVDILEKKFIAYNTHLGKYEIIRNNCQLSIERRSETNNVPKSAPTGFPIKKTAEDTVYSNLQTGESLQVTDTIEGLDPSAVNTLEIGLEPYVMNFSAAPLITKGKKYHVADCKLMNKGTYRQQSVLPKLTVKLETDESENGQKNEILYVRYESYFSWVAGKVWECTNRFDNFRFLRVVHEHRLNDNTPYAIGKIKYLQRDHAWIEIQNRGAVVKIKETKYLDTKEYEPFQYVGIFLLDQEPSTSIGLWKSGTEILANYEKYSKTDVEVLPRKIEYRLEWKSYKIPVGDGSPNSMEIDTKWEKTVGNRGMTIRCMLDKSDAVAQYQTKITKNSKNIDDSFYGYFEDVRKEAWRCSDEEKTVSIMRVHHQFVLKSVTSITELIHYDGVTVFAGRDQKDELDITTLEIAVTKFHNIDGNFAVVKFEGKVLFEEEQEPKIQARRLKDAGKKDLYYSTLPDRAVYKKGIAASGSWLEISAADAKSPANYFRKRDIVHCKKMDSTYISNDVKDRVKPIVKYNQHVDATGLLTRSEMDLKKLGGCFKLDFSIMTCKIENEHDSPQIYRVVNKLFSLPDKCEIAVIHYHSGVTVEKDDENSIIIKEIKYLNLAYKEIKFDGFTILDEEEEEVKTGKTGGVRDINYLLDTEVVYSANLYYTPNGVTFAIHSRWEETVPATEGKVICEEMQDTSYNKLYAAHISIVSPESQGKDILKYVRRYVSSNQKNLVSSYFKDEHQKVFICKRNKQLIFYRVVNELILAVPTACVYHGDGVQVGPLVFPDTKLITQVREVKFIHPSSSKVLKYDGELSIVRKLHTASDYFDTFEDTIELIPPEELAKLREKREKNRKKRCYTLNSMRVFLLSRNPSTKTLAQITYSTKHKYEIFRNKKAVGSDAYGIGHPWEEEYSSMDGPLKCVQDQWNLINCGCMFSKIVKYNGDKMYELDEFSKEQLMTINPLSRSECHTLNWICMNEKDTLFRMKIRTRFDAVNISTIIHPSTVTIKYGENSEKNWLEVTDSFFVRPGSSKILKYEGQLKLVKNVRTAQSSNGCVVKKMFSRLKSIAGAP